jgi:hypothetical protein
MSELRYATAFYEAVMAFARRFGEPLPKRTLEMGNADNGWGVKLNPTAEEVDKLPPFSVFVSWNGRHHPARRRHHRCGRSGQRGFTDRMAENRRRLGPQAQERAMSVNSQRRAAYVREWNSHFPPGTKVEYQGRLVKTWSPAGLGIKYEPSVFLEDVEEPVSLNSLTVPGWTRK